ncbi:MAG: hypothetical protein KBT82_17355 [Marinobacter sp.]|uniref:hypothetical protein n=1 Tax=Marinobacter sp. TaxID=50741 RepID=UPI001B5E4F7B|nr:hypothetical protein [Marinobacter sp.]MBQ0748020.1 hypothetical protein [Marinobacter sp.]MBQ0815915.1 hypothetical protein [Marinobacter sp.]|tara:strand:+ start:4212 stop:4985 length:774 start_codon:yes stop_codon:yes gene_type:complete
MLISEGAQHYVLMLIPSLLRDIEKLGLRRIIRTSDFSEQEVTALYFEFVSANRVLPANPHSIEPASWQHLLHCVRVMSSLVGLATIEDLERARETAIRRYLPHAKESLKNEYDQIRREGKVDFRLAGILRAGDSPENSGQVCMEAIRREREQRVESIKCLGTEHLTSHETCVVEAAKAYVVSRIDDAPKDFGILDLVIRLLDLLRLVLVLESRSTGGATAVSSNFSVENIVLGIGNALYRSELGLHVSSLGLAKVNK